MNKSEFSGFTAKTVTFLTNLSKNNNKEWFEKNKPTFKNEVEAPAKALVSTLEKNLSETFGINYTGKLFRIYRDVRFSKDKTPYNPHLRMLFSTPDSEAALFFSIEPSSLIIGSGCMEFSKPTLESYRNKVEDEKEAKALQKIIDRINKKQTVRIEAPELKKVPRGFEGTDINEEFLRRKGIACWFDQDHHDSLLSSKGATYLTNQFKKLYPINDWIDSI